MRLLEPDDSADRAPLRVPAWRRYTRFWGSRVDSDVDDELGFHLEMRVRDYIAQGMSEPEARAAAARRLGDVRTARTACLTIGQRRERRMTRARTLDALLQDVRYALRTLNRQRSWATVAILTIALGTGASTAVFSVVNSLVLHPLPYRDADRVAMIWRVDPKSGIMLSPNDKMLDAWRARAHTVEALETFQTSAKTLTGHGDATLVHTAAVGPTFAAFTGIRPILGRTFVPDDASNGPAVVLGEALWRERFAASKDVIGTHVTLNDKPYAVIGVVPAAFRLPIVSEGQTEAWLLAQKDTLGFGGMTLTRLRPGATAAAASKELDAIVESGGLKEKFGSKDFAAKLVRPGEMIGFRTSLFLLAGAVVLLLVVACANVAHLLLARGATRERELAIRLALGAGTRRLARQLLTESLVLAGAGCAVGIALAFAGVRTLIALRPQSLSQLSLAEVDWRALLVAVAISLITGIVFGLTAAANAIRHTTSDSLRATSLTGTGTARTHAVRSALVVTEMALSAMLLVCAVLLTRSVIKLQHVDPGFNTAGLWSMRLVLPETRYPTPASRMAFLADAEARARAVPAVVSATLADAAPPGFGGMMIAQFQPDGVPVANAPSFMAMNHVGPDFFQVAGIRLIQGATFTPGAGKRSEVIINEGLARRFWGSVNPVGHRMMTPTPGKKPSADDGMLIVGVAANVPTRGLSADPAEPIVYYPRAELPEEPTTDLIVRTRDGSDPVASLRAIVATLDPKLAPPPVRSVSDAIRETISSQRFTMTLLAIFAGLAVVLSAIGLYGVIAYVVTQRTREIGIRIALGATPRHVARAIVARGLILSAIGLVVGLGVATWGTKLIKSALFGVTGTDPMSYAATGLLLLVISVLACVVPMRRALAVDPVIAMRGD